MKKSKLDKLTKTELHQYIVSSTTVGEVLLKVGLEPKGNNHNTLYRYIRIHELLNELKELRERSKNKKVARMNDIRSTPNTLLFIENCKSTRKSVKNRIIKDNLLPYKCAKCGNIGEWQGEKLILQLEHKNGVSNDNRLENLEFLCPNCHAQTETYSGRNMQGIKERNKCKEQRKKVIRQKQLDLIEERRKLLETIDMSVYGWVQKVADEWGVSHTTVRRWIKRFYPECTFFERK